MARMGAWDVLPLRDLLATLADNPANIIEYAAHCVDQADQWAHLNALIAFDPVRFQAVVNSAAERFQSGPLHGLPIVVKDNIDVTDFPTTGNTPALASHRPTDQGPVVQSLGDAGAVVMAKTVLVELAGGPGVGVPTAGEKMRHGLHGAAHNPYDVSRTAGSSSSGTAAAVAAGIAPAGLGTDTGGSVRTPAAYCGIAGYRPSIGRYSQEGMIRLSETRDTIGLMAPRVADVAILDCVLCRDHRPLGIADVRGLRLGRPTSHFLDNIAEDVASLFEAAVRSLSDAGAVIIDVAPGDIAGPVAAMRDALGLGEAIPNLRRYLSRAATGIEVATLIEHVQTTGLGHYLRRMLDAEQEINPEYEQALNVYRPTLQETYRRIFNDNDIAAMIFPTCPTVAGPFEFTLGAEGGLTREFVTRNQNVTPATLTGTPGVTVPTGLTPSGLPAAINFDGPDGRDKELLGIAAAFERLRGPMQRPSTAPN